MSQIFIPRSPERVERRSFETAAAILMGTPVMLASTGKVAIATSEALAVGIVDNMPSYRAANSTGTVASGDVAEVALFGLSFKGVSGGTFAKGGYLTISAGALTASGSATTMIAIDASSASGQSVEYIKK